MFARQDYGTYGSGLQGSTGSSRAGVWTLGWSSRWPWKKLRGFALRLCMEMQTRITRSSGYQKLSLCRCVLISWCCAGMDLPCMKAIVLNQLLLLLLKIFFHALGIL